jgi:mono/diheme cytochrome c family protein
MNGTAFGIVKPFQNLSLLQLVLLVSTLTFAGCSARRGEPLYGLLPITNAAVKMGQQVFMRECHQCHPAGEAGLGPAINDKPLPGFLMRFQIRNGLGAMPAFSQNDINPEELDNLLAYLSELRHHPRKTN